jgi:hypothetical protein
MLESPAIPKVPLSGALDRSFSEKLISLFKCYGPAEIMHRDYPKRRFTQDCHVQGVGVT